jgi:hypothetical protein
MQDEKAPTFPELASVPVGVYKVVKSYSWWEIWKPRERGGYLDVVKREKDGSTEIMWMSHRDSHNPLTNGNTFSLNIDKTGKIICYMIHILSWHIKWGHGSGGKEEFEKAVNIAGWLQKQLCYDIPNKNRV